LARCSRVARGRRSVRGGVDGADAGATAPRARSRRSAGRGAHVRPRRRSAATGSPIRARTRGSGYRRSGHKRAAPDPGVARRRDARPGPSWGRRAHLGDERGDLRRLVLGDRRRRTRKPPRGPSLQRGLPLPPDGARRGGGARLVAGLRGLPLPRVQHQHGLQPHGHGDPQSAGEGAHDGPVGRLAGGRRRANRSRRQRARLHGIGHLRIAALPRRYHLQASFAEFDLGVILSSMVSRQISLL
jgi:hypothetical protein